MPDGELTRLNNYACTQHRRSQELHLVCVRLATGGGEIMVDDLAHCRRVDSTGSGGKAGRDAGRGDAGGEVAVRVAQWGGGNQLRAVRCHSCGVQGPGSIRSRPPAELHRARGQAARVRVPQSAADEVRVADAHPALLDPVRARHRARRARRHHGVRADGQV